MIVKQYAFRSFNNLHKSKLKGHLNVVELLIKHNAQIMLQDENGRTALHRAAERDRLEVCKFLLGKEPKLKEIKDGKEKIAYEYIMSNANDDFKLLLKP